LIGGVHIGARALLDINLIWLAISLAHPSGEEGGDILLVQMIFILYIGSIWKLDDDMKTFER
jgi:hypothetical protein